MSTNWCRPDSTLLHVMVSRLQCPFQGDQALCSFYQSEDFCPFGHRSDRNPACAIPPYICVDYLVGKCTPRHTWKVPIKHDWLVSCSTGYHPTGMQLLDLEVLDRKVFSVEQKQEDQALEDQVQQDQEQGPDDDLKCAICLEQVRSPFGLLEHCRHVFCAECIAVWKETDHREHKPCPVCRVKSRQVLLWPNTEPIRNEQDKLQLFRLQARCNNLSRGGNQTRDDSPRREESFLSRLRRSFANLEWRFRMARQLQLQFDLQREPVHFEDEVD